MITNPRSQPPLRNNDCLIQAEIIGVAACSCDGCYDGDGEVAVTVSSIKCNHVVETTTKENNQVLRYVFFLYVYFATSVFLTMLQTM